METETVALVLFFISAILFVIVISSGDVNSNASVIVLSIAFVLFITSLLLHNENSNLSSNKGKPVSSWSR